MKLVILAAGHGRRFGGLKQIAPVGPSGEAVMDYTVRFAEECGYEGIVLVVREEIRSQLAGHVEARWTGSVPVEIVSQPAQQGTTYAVLCTEPLLDGPFAVANADDLYEAHALQVVRSHFGAPSTTPHVLVGYELSRTVLTPAEVKRGICRLGPAGLLGSIEEHKVRLRGDGRYEAEALEPVSGPGELPALRVLGGREPVSMNLWGFSPTIFEHLHRAVEGVRPGESAAELLLPQVVGELVRQQLEEVRVVMTNSRCYGVTHKEDVPLVRQHLDVEFGPLGAAFEGRGA